MHGRAALAVVVAVVMVAGGGGVGAPPPAAAQDPPAAGWLYVPSGPDVLALRADRAREGVDVTGDPGRAHLHPDVADDGRTLVVEVRPVDGGPAGDHDDEADILVIDVTTGTTTDVVTGSGFQGEPSVAAGSSHLYHRDGAQLVRRDLASGEVVVVASGHDAVAHPAASPTAASTFAYVATDGGRSQVRVADLDAGTDVVVAPGGYLSAAHPSWAPDGSALVFSCQLEVGGDLELCRAGVGDADVVVIPTDEGDARTPVVSPDGTRVAWRGLHSAVLTAELDGGGRRTITGAQTFADRFAGLAWGPGVAVVGDPLPPPPAPPPPPPTPPPMTPLPAGGVDGDPATTDRLQFADPVLAAVAISEARFGDADAAADPDDPAGDRRTARHAVLSTTQGFADSLAGSPLLADGPLLFSAQERMGAATARELTRLLPPGGTVYLLGGTAALSATVEREVRDLGLSPHRLSGPSRFETAVVVAREVIALGGTTEEVLVARGTGTAEDPTSAWADSVTGGVHAATSRVPVLLTPSGHLHPAVADLLEETGATATLLGGRAALAEEVEDALPGSRRIAGASRADTAARIATELLGLDVDGPRTTVLVNGVSGSGWLFGLAAGGLAADLGGALLLTGQLEVPPETASVLSACGDPQVETLLAGSEALLGASVEEHVTALDGGACR